MRSTYLNGKCSYLRFYPKHDGDIDLYLQPNPLFSIENQSFDEKLPEGP
jgi:hypothetical protein